MDLVWDVVLVVVFVLVGGVFSMSELALVSLREGQVRAMREARARGSAAVERLRANTNRYLSAVQIGVTLAGFFASAFGGATLASRLSPAVEGWGVSAGLAATIALVLVTAGVSYLSLVLGELVPKRIALQRPDTVSRLVAPGLDRVARLARPVIWLLGASTNMVVRLIGLDPHQERDEVTEEELRDMVAAQETLDDDERRLLEDVFSAADRRVAEVMIPRTEVEFLPATMTLADAAKATEEKPHSRYPVTRESADDVVGFVHVRDLLTALRHPEVGTRRRTLVDVMRPVAFVTGNQGVLRTLSRMRRTRQHIAVVVDEYGGTDGIVTLEDLVEELVGEIEDEHDVREQVVHPRDGSLEVDGLLHRDDVHEQVGVQLPEGPFDTLAGFVMTELGRVPVERDVVEALDRRFTVTAMDGRRPDRILVEPLTPRDDDEGDDEGDGEGDEEGDGRVRRRELRDTREDDEQQR